MQVKDSIKEYEYKLERVVHFQGKLLSLWQHYDGKNFGSPLSCHKHKLQYFVSDTFDENLMAEFKENVTYNNEDMEEIADWYQKSNEYYSNRIDNSRRYLIALIQQMTVDDNAGKITKSVSPAAGLQRPYIPDNFDKVMK